MSVALLKRSDLVWAFLICLLPRSRWLLNSLVLTQVQEWMVLLDAGRGVHTYPLFSCVTMGNWTFIGVFRLLLEATKPALCFCWTWGQNLSQDMFICFKMRFQLATTWRAAGWRMVTDMNESVTDIPYLTKQNHRQNRRAGRTAVLVTSGLWINPWNN